eukprot:1505353-Rhodomonas_salina.2
MGICGSECIPERFLIVILIVAELLPGKSHGPCSLQKSLNLASDHFTTEIPVGMIAGKTSRLDRQKTQKNSGGIFLNAFALRQKKEFKTRVTPCARRVLHPDDVPLSISPHALAPPGTAESGRGYPVLGLMRSQHFKILEIPPKIVRGVGPGGAREAEAPDSEKVRLCPRRAEWRREQRVSVGAILLPTHSTWATSHRTLQRRRCRNGPSPPV